MPSIIPSYVYTIFASIIVGTLIVAAMGLVMANVKAEAETQQLSNIKTYVAAKAMELSSAASIGEATVRSALDIPALIGNQRYWIQIENDTAHAWVQGGLGESPASVEARTFIPSGASASGSFLSGSDLAWLSCESNSSGTYLMLYGGS